MDQPTYSQKYIAFIDILGFKEAIKATNDKDKFSELHATLNTIKKFSEKTLALTKETQEKQNHRLSGKISDLNIQIFSDSIVISINKDDLYQPFIFGFAAMISLILFSKGMWCRGAITIGSVYHEDNIIFGQGLIDAYELESKCAIYPRIIISHQLENLISQDHIRQLPLIKDKDDFYFIDVFDKFYLNSLSKVLEIPASEAHEKLIEGREKVVFELETNESFGIQQKSRWLKNYFNSRTKNINLQEINF